MSRTVAIATLGCKTNQFESAAMEERLQQAGFELVPFNRGAALVIINTCTVTAATDAQSRNLIRRARRFNPDCRVVVTGCYAQIDPERLRQLPGVVLVLGNAEKKDFLQYLEQDAREPRVAVSDIAAETAATPLHLTSFAEHSRAFLQIQNGCDAFCSYCIIPYARGRSRSVPADDILRQVITLTEQGYAEIVLTGIHIGGYGQDLSPARSLLQLIERIERETSIARLRLGSVEPTEIPEALIERMASSSILCPHLHIPLQSGSDTVLQRMNRHYDRDFFRALVERIQQRIPQAAIGVDLITGFPGETAAEFEQTRSLIAELPLAYLHVFPFSRRPGTPAADMPGQLGGDLIRERAALLRQLGESKQRRFEDGFIGSIQELVVEGGGAAGYGRGLSGNYLSVCFPDAGCRRGERIQVRISGRREDGHLLGERL